MPRTLLAGNQVLDGSIQRQDLDVTNAGFAVIRKVLPGSGITLMSSGVDQGTGDVTIATDATAWTANWLPIGNAVTAPTVNGIVAPTVLGTATARNVATTNNATAQKRLGHVSAATAGAFAGHFFPAGAQQYMLGNATFGGFKWICRFAVSDAAAVAGARQFIGMRNIVTTPTNVEPNTLTNSFGIAQLSTDATQWYIVYGGSAAQAAIPLGTGLGAPTLVNAAFELSLSAPKSSNNIVNYSVTNLSNNVTVAGQLTGVSGTVLPLPSALLAPIAWRCNNATLLAVGLDICSHFFKNSEI